MTERDYILALRNLPKWSQSFWRGLSVKVQEMIFVDAKKGVLQSGVFRYRSKEYVKQKQNYFRRSTYDTKSKRVRAEKIKLANGKFKPTNRKLSAFKGINVASNYTANVNMMVTGQLIKGLKYAKSDTTSTTIQYSDKDEDKLLGNLDRPMDQIRETNMQTLAKMLEDDMQKRISQLSNMRMTRTIQL